MGGLGVIAVIIVGAIVTVVDVILLIMVLVCVVTTVIKLRAKKPAAVSGDQPVIYDDITGTTTDPVPVTNNPSYDTVVSVNPNPSYGPVGFKL
jgi:hypothetical protein